MSEHSTAIRNRFEAAYIAAGMPAQDNWYNEAHDMVRDLANKHGIDFSVCAAVVAVLSPRIRWRTSKGNGYPNLEAADNLIRGHRHHIKKTVVFSNVAGFDFNKSKAWDILRTNDTSLVSGPKVVAFYNNIINPDNDDYVTIDSWMFAIAYGLDFTASKTNFAPNKRQHEEIKSALISVARQYAISTIDLQAIVWQWAKESSGHWRTN